MKKLWGDNFYNEKDKKWFKDVNVGDRGFVKYILIFIYYVFIICMKSFKEKLFVLVEKMGVKFIVEDKELEEKQFLKVIMRKWFLVGDVMLQMIVIYFLFFVIVQRYRMENLYEGFDDDVVVIGKNDIQFELKIIY